MSFEFGNLDELENVPPDFSYNATREVLTIDNYFFNFVVLFLITSNIFYKIFLSFEGIMANNLGHCRISHTTKENPIRKSNKNQQ